VNIAILRNFDGTILEIDSVLYKNIEHTIYRIIKGEPEKLQEVYNVFYGNTGIRRTFLEYKDAEYAVKTEDETDPEQLYIKGIVDGMRVFYTFLQTYGKSSDRIDWGNGL
jgi:hypothetical protein